jgi:hypothetical protein
MFKVTIKATAGGVTVDSYEWSPSQLSEYLLYVAKQKDFPFYMEIVQIQGRK